MLKKIKNMNHFLYDKLIDFNLYYYDYHDIKFLHIMYNSFLIKTLTELKDEYIIQDYKFNIYYELEIVIFYKKNNKINKLTYIHNNKVIKLRHILQD